MVNIVQVSSIENLDQLLGGLPKGLSIFDPILCHEAKEAIEAEGEVFLSQNSIGEKDGLFIYDKYEATGTIFTRSREAFEQFYTLKPSSYIFSELDVGRPKETWNIWQLDVQKASSHHRFRHHVSIEYDASEIERFIASTQPETNRRWIRVALDNGDKCFVVKIANRIVGMAWMTIVDRVARSHGLYVEPQFRRMGVMSDNFQARLIYLKARGVHTLINEISALNIPSSRHATKIGETITSQIFLYGSPEPGGSVMTQKDF